MGSHFVLKTKKGRVASDGALLIATQTVAHVKKKSPGSHTICCSYSPYGGGVSRKTTIPTMRIGGTTIRRNNITLRRKRNTNKKQNKKTNQTQKNKGADHNRNTYSSKETTDSE